jgi:hypothetical protein
MDPIHISIGIIIIIVLLGGLYGLTTTLPPITISTTTVTIKECKTNEDCIPDEPLMGVSYYCENGICKTKPLGDPLYCEIDEDCVPATCCHPDSCINKDYRPDCKGIACTMECRPNTMDCSQGKCVCVDNTCQVELL